MLGSKFSYQWSHEHKGLFFCKVAFQVMMYPQIYFRQSIIDIFRSEFCAFPNVLCDDLMKGRQCPICPILAVATAVIILACSSSRVLIFLIPDVAPQKEACGKIIYPGEPGSVPCLTNAFTKEGLCCALVALAHMGLCSWGTVFVQFATDVEYGFISES
jgi:hypothetical protein